MKECQHLGICQTCALEKICLYNERSDIMQNRKFELDQTPAVIYTLDSPVGVGKLYFNGIQAKGLVNIEISAHTMTEKARQYATLKLEVSPEAFANSLTEDV
jgi:hypothetical protein